MYLPGGWDTQISCCCCCCCVKLPRRCLSLKFTFSCGKCQNSSEGNHAKRGLLLSAFFFCLYSASRSHFIPVSSVSRIFHLLLRHSLRKKQEFTWIYTSGRSVADRWRRAQASDEQQAFMNVLLQHRSQFLYIRGEMPCKRNGQNIQRFSFVVGAAGAESFPGVWESLRRTRSTWQNLSIIGLQMKYKYTCSPRPSHNEGRPSNFLFFFCCTVEQRDKQLPGATVWQQSHAYKSHHHKPQQREARLRQSVCNGTFRLGGRSSVTMWSQKCQ